MKRRGDVLTTERAELAEKNRPLAIHLAKKYARRYPRVDLDDLVQDACAALVNAARLHDPAKGCPFGAFALHCILRAIWSHIKKHGWAPRELSLESPVGDSTVLDVVDADMADAEMRGEPADERAAALAFDLRELVESCPDLTDRERRILCMSYIEGLPVAEIARRVRRSAGTVSTDSARAIRKLRAAMRARGMNALSPSAPVQSIGTGRPAARPLA